MSLKKGLSKLVLPLVDRLAASLKVTDPWERFEVSLEHHHFGEGSRHPFPWYFEGQSSVVVTSPADVAAWLFDCEYVSDPDLFQERDFWQHPRTFEQLRRGDCEDHALWGWRKLVDLGVNASLVIGTFRRETYAEGGHVWVVFEHEDASFILEGTAHDRERVVRPFLDAREDYTPHAAVDREFRTYGFMGASTTSALRHEARKRGLLGDGAA